MRKGLTVLLAILFWGSLTPMAQCCTDADTIFAYDADDGAPVSAHFTGINTPFQVDSGTGINGTNSLYGSSYGEGSVLFDSDLDACGNHRAEFAVGFYFDANQSGYQWPLFEVRSSTGVGLETIVSAYFIYPDLVIYEGVTGTEAMRIRNAFTNGTMRRYEFRGSIGTIDVNQAPSGGGGGRAANSDGWIEVRIDGRVYQNGDDFATIDPTSEPDPCAKGTTNIRWVAGRGTDTTGTNSGWDKIMFGPSGHMDCIYIKEKAQYCLNNADTRSSGGDTTACPDRQPGDYPNAYPASYTAPTGEGIPATASDPSDAQSLTGITTPLISCDITLCDSTVVSVAQVPIVRAGQPGSEARVVRWGDVPYPLSDRFGNMRAQQWDVTLADEDGAWRARLDTGANRYYKRWEAVLYGESDTARLAGTARRTLARGRCLSVKSNGDQTITLTFSDELSRHDSPWSLDRELPHVLIGDVFGTSASATGIEFLSDPTAEIAGLGLPILLGEPTDEYRAAENPPTTPVGILPLHDLGDVRLLGSETWRAYAVSLYACYRIDALFGFNGDDQCPGSVRLDPDLFTSQFLVPNKGAWSSYFATPYITVTRNGVTYRTTVIFGRGPISDAHVNGKVPLSVNPCGIDANGDGTGDLIDDLSYMFQVLGQIVLTRDTIGAWQTMPTFADGTAKIRSSSFADVKAIHDAQLPTRWRGGLIIDSRQSARQWLAALAVAGQMRYGLNHHGQLYVTTLDDQADLSNLTTFTDRLHIAADSFQITTELGAELENAITYDLGPQPAFSRLTRSGLTVTASQSVSNWGDTYKGDRLTLAAIYRPEVAECLVGRRLVDTQDGITRGEFTIDLAGLDLTGGQLIRNTDIRGFGQAGWTDRILRVTDRVAQLNPDALTLQAQWEDEQRVLAVEGMTSTASVLTQVGSESLATAAVVGSESAGTAYRVG